MKADTQTIDILLLGSGGREHALAAKLAASPRAGKLYIAPGNGGTASCGENVVLDDCDPAAVAAFAQSHGCGLVVIGPEAPLVAGVADAVRAAGIPCFGPGAEGAQMEGSKLFSAEIVIPNDGVLAKDMVATATATVGGDTVYPYEAAKLEYYRVGDLTSTVSGTVISSNLVDYLSVTPGQVLVRIDGEDSETEIFTARQNLEEAQKRLETAQKNLDNCNAVAPISGQVIGLSVTPGQELQANSTLVTISDTSTVTISATVDERNISYIKTGMSVNLDQWGTSAFGTVETVSLSSTVNNGVASYPITISADNTEGTLQVNSYVNYEIQASQNDNCLMVPIQAVRTVGLDDGSTATVVYVQADSQPDNALELPYQDEEIPAGFYPVQVEIGIQDTYNVEIKSGLNEGDTVYTQMMTTEAWG